MNCKKRNMLYFGKRKMKNVLAKYELNPYNHF